MKEYVKDWSKSDLLYFPKIEPLAKSQKKKNKQIYDSLVKEHAKRSLKKYGEALNHLDVELNLNRLLEQDPKYLSIGRNRPKQNSCFSSIILHKIMHDAHLIAKFQNNQEFVKRFETRTREKTMSYFESGQRCKRYLKHDLNFDRREYNRLIKCEVNLDLKESDDVKARTKQINKLTPVSHKREMQKLAKLEPIENKIQNDEETRVIKNARNPQVKVLKSSEIELVENNPKPVIIKKLEHLIVKKENINTNRTKTDDLSDFKQYVFFGYDKKDDEAILLNEEYNDLEILSTTYLKFDESENTSPESIIKQNNQEATFSSIEVLKLPKLQKI